MKSPSLLSLLFITAALYDGIVGVVFHHGFDGGIPDMWKPFAILDLVFLLMFVWAFLVLGKSPVKDLQGITTLHDPRDSRAH